MVCEVLCGIRDTEIFDRMKSFFALFRIVNFDVASAAVQERLVVISTDEHFGRAPAFQVRARIRCSSPICD